MARTLNTGGRQFGSGGPDRTIGRWAAVRTGLACSIWVHLAAGLLMLGLRPKLPTAEPPVDGVAMVFEAPAAVPPAASAPDLEAARDPVPTDFPPPEPMAQAPLTPPVPEPSPPAAIRALPAPTPERAVEPPPPDAARSPPNPVVRPPPARPPPPPHPVAAVRPPVRQAVRTASPSLAANRQADPPVQLPSVPAQTHPPAPASPASPSEVSPGWQTSLAAWLRSHRNYPDEARRHAEEGVALIRFNVTRDGQVLAVTLVRSSGSVTLDEAAQAMVRGAHLPPFPIDMPQLQTTVTVPVRYRLEQ